MAEILVCIKDRGNSGIPAIYHRAPKAGDVVAVVPDGHPWGSLELGGHKWGEVECHANRDNPTGLKRGDRYYVCEASGCAKPISEHPNGKHDFFRIYRLPFCTVEQLEGLVHPEQQAGQTQSRVSPYLQFRAFFINPDLLLARKPDVHAHWQDDDRNDRVKTIPLTWDQLQGVISQRAPVLY